jgi:hypothetical protein
MLLSASAAAQGPLASDRLSVSVPRQMALTMIEITPYPDETYTPYGAEAPYASCYRVRRCSLYDLYRFADRPNWLTRLAPDAPKETDPPVYTWRFVPVTPEENILPKYRTASQVRAEYRAVGSPLDDPD